MSKLNEPVPMLDLSGQFAELEQEWLATIRDTGARGSFILGPNVTALEQEVSDYLGVGHAVGASMPEVIRICWESVRP